jgi:hypothetical protein
MWPNFDLWLQTAWGAENSFFSTCGMGGSVGFVFGQNPPYYLDDFLSIYPKFFGVVTTLSGASIAAGSPTITLASTLGLSYGQFLQSPGNFPKGTVITAIGSGTITINNNALVTTATAVLQVYEAPPVPTAVIQIYINLALASLVQARWQDAWYIAIAWYVAHYLTLYAKSDAAEVGFALQSSVHGEVPAGTTPGTVYTLSAQPPGDTLSTLTKNGEYLRPGGVDYTLSGLTITLTAPTTLGDQLYATWLVQTQVLTPGISSGAQIAAQGLMGGIQTSKSVGDVSVGYSPLTSLEQFGQWQLTTYGQQLATMAKVIGGGPVLIL